MSFNEKDTNDMANLYEQVKKDTQELVEEGMLDRAGARLAGVGGAIKGLGQSAAGIAKGAWAGVNADTAGVQAAQQQRQQGGVAAGYNKAKINSIVGTFQKDMAALFGNTWQQTYPDLAKSLTTLTQATPTTTQPTQNNPPTNPTQLTPQQINMIKTKAAKDNNVRNLVSTTFKTNQWQGINYSKATPKQIQELQQMGVI